MSKNAKPLLNRVAPARKDERLTVSVPADLKDQLEAYRRFYADAHGEEAPGLPQLLVLMTRQFVASDKAFGRFTAAAAPAPAEATS